MGRRTSKLLRDYDVVAFGKYSGDLGGQTKENNSMFLLPWGSDSLNSFGRRLHLADLASGPE